MPPITPNNAASLPGTILPEAQGALEVGQKRQIMEQRAPKRERAAGEKKKESPFQLDTETVFLPHTQYFGSARKGLIDLMGEKLFEYKMGVGEDPMEVGSQAWTDMQTAQQGLVQQISNSNQVKEWFTEFQKEYGKNPNKYKPGALEAAKEYARDPRAIRGERLPPTPGEVVDKQKIYNEALAKLKPEQSAKAFSTKKGKNYRETVSTLSKERLLETAMSLAGDPHLSLAMRDEWQEIVKTDPDKAKMISAQAEGAGMPIEAYMIYNDLEPYAYEQQQKFLSGSGYGAGFETDMEAANWLVEAMRGVSSGELSGLDPDTGEPLSFFTGQRSPSGRRLSDVFTGFKYGQEQDEKGKKYDVRIKKVERDDENDKFRLILDKGGGLEETTEWYSRDEAFSEVVPRIAEFNKEFKMGAVSKAEQEEYGDIRGRKGNVRQGLEEKRRPFIPGSGGSGPFIPGR